MPCLRCHGKGHLHLNYTSQGIYPMCSYCNMPWVSSLREQKRPLIEFKTLRHTKRSPQKEEIVLGHLKAS